MYKIFPFLHTNLILFLIVSRSDEEFIDLDKEFEMSITNSAVYIISMTMQIGNFAVNYKVNRERERERERERGSID